MDAVAFPVQKVDAVVYVTHANAGKRMPFLRVP